MAITEDLSVFLADFGVSVTAGAVSGLGILEMPTQVVAAGQVLSTDYALLCRADQFGGLLYGDVVSVAGVTYVVRENRLLDDGAFCEVALQRDDNAVPVTPTDSGDDCTAYAIVMG